MIIKDKQGYSPYFQVFDNLDLLEILCTVDRKAQIVFFNLAVNIIDGNKIYLNVKELKKRTNVHPGTVYNSLWRLKKVRIIYKQAPKCYVLNPFLVWKGSQGKLLEARREWGIFMKESKNE